LCNGAARHDMRSLCQITGNLEVFEPGHQVYSEGATCPSLAVRTVTRKGIEAYALRENVAHRLT
jgi:hypothetical protein